MMPNKKGAARRLRLNFTYTLSMARWVGKMGHGFGLYFPIGMKWVAEIGRRRGLDKVCRFSVARSKANHRGHRGTRRNPRVQKQFPFRELSAEFSRFCLTPIQIYVCMYNYGKHRVRQRLSEAEKLHRARQN